MAFQRARQPEQKQKRRADLLAAAAALFEERGFDGAPLSEIAARAGVSKAAVYRYFESKEQIFLELLVQDYATWAASLERRLAELSGSDDAAAVAAAMVGATRELPRLPALSSILSSVLEHNVSVDSLCIFKTRGNEVLARLVGALQGVLPSLDVRALGEFLHVFVMMSNALWPEAHSPPVVQEVLSRPEFSHMRVDYEADLERLATVFLRGLMAEQRG